MSYKLKYWIFVFILFLGVLPFVEAGTYYMTSNSLTANTTTINMGDTLKITLSVTTDNKQYTGYLFANTTGSGEEAQFKIDGDCDDSGDSWKVISITHDGSVCEASTVSSGEIDCTTTANPSAGTADQIWILEPCDGASSGSPYVFYSTCEPTGSGACTDFPSTTSSVSVNGYPKYTTSMAAFPNPVTLGQDIKFTATATDEGQYNLSVCSSTGFTDGKCTGTTYCTSPLTNSGSETSCNYTTSSTGSLTAYGFLCDATKICNPNYNTTTTTIDPLFGSLSPSISAPEDNSEKTWKTQFRLNASVTCTGDAIASCGTVYAYARYNGSSASSDTIISTTPGASPIYVTQQGISEELTGGQSMDVSFIINLTVSGYKHYELDVLFNSSYGSANIAEADTADRTVIAIDNPPEITSPVIYPAILRANGNAMANLTYSDLDSDSGNVYFKWYVNNINVYTQIISSVSAGAEAKATLYHGNYTAGDLLNVSVYANDGDQNSSTLWSAVKTISPPGVSYSKFDGDTTDFDNLPDTENVDQPVLEITSHGKIKWTGNSLNVSGMDFDSYVDISNNLIEADSGNLNPDLNSEANLTLYNLGYQFNPVLYKDGTLCTGECTFVSYDSGTLEFVVDGFSSYYSGENSKLVIWDETDSEMPYANQVKIENQDVLFFANYTSIASGDAIEDENAFCNISFGESWITMDFNSTKMLYQYKRSFVSSGTYNFNISCDGSLLGYEQINLSDNVLITNFDAYKFWNGTYNTTSKMAGIWNVTSEAWAPWFFAVSLDTLRNFSLDSSNTPPGKPTLISPSNGNSTLINNPPIFIWTNVTNEENDVLTFSINITSSECPDYGLIEDINALNYTPISELVLDCNYTWSVRAYDGELYSDWADNFTFIIRPTIILTLVNNSISFGNMSIGQSADTDTLGGPFVVRNDGNIMANISWVSINDSIFTSVGANTEYLRFKVDNSTEKPGSFNYSDSTIVWTNLSLISETNRTAISHLNYDPEKNEAEIDINITIPLTEPPGFKSILFYIIGQGT
jgi:hypothetical protein